MRRVHQVSERTVELGVAIRLVIIVDQVEKERLDSSALVTWSLRHAVLLQHVAQGRDGCLRSHFCDERLDGVRLVCRGSPKVLLLVVGDDCRDEPFDVSAELLLRFLAELLRFRRRLLRLFECFNLWGATRFRRAAG